MRLLAVWLINAIALLALPWLLPSIHVASFATALAVAVVLGLINAVIRPVLLVLTLPVTLLTLGLFIFAINGMMFMLAAWLLDGFVVDGFVAGVIGAALYSMISWLLTRLLLNRLPPGARLLASDLSPAMVEQAKSGLSDPRLEFAVMDAEAPSLAPASFDLVVSSLAAQWFEDLPATLNRLVGLLKPEGTLLLGTLGSGTFSQWRGAHADWGWRRELTIIPPRVNWPHYAPARR